MLPREFLSQIADRYGLSQEQRDVFLEKFGNDKIDCEIQRLLTVSDGTLRYRLGEIYKKFLIQGKGTGKASRLLSFLNTEYQKFNISASLHTHPSGNDTEADTQEKTQNTKKIDELVQSLRQQRHEKIQDQCGSMRMLDIAWPIELGDIYTDVNVLEEIPRDQRRDIRDIMRDFNSESQDFDRLGLSRCQIRLPGWDAISQHRKLMVLGKPGSGKTTFLQWVAVQCNLGQFERDKVPMFIRLKSLAENTKRDNSEFRILNYISQEFASCGIVDKSTIETILTQGRTLILLDGLDEVSDNDAAEIIENIRQFVINFWKNKYIITCRIAANRYKFVQEGFTEVEVADFNVQQIEAFAKKWFGAVAKNNLQERQVIAEQFIEKLKLPENRQIRELAITPILLNLTCLFYQHRLQFPLDRSKLYEGGLEILLNKWDKFRNIPRDQVYRNLTLVQKVELLIQVAANNFVENRYFFEQQEVEIDIANFLRNLLSNQTDGAILEDDSKVVLKSIEAQHGLLVERAGGIYSFSHLTFQEYFTAKAFVANLTSQVLEQLISGIRGGRWREVFLLYGAMLTRVNDLRPLKKCIDSLLDTDETLQQFLSWVKEKSLSVQVTYKPAAVRAFYFAFFYRTYSVSGRQSDYTPLLDFSLALRLDSNLDFSYESRLDYDFAIDLALANACYKRFTRMLENILETELPEELRNVIQEFVRIQKYLSQIEDELYTKIQLFCHLNGINISGCESIDYLQKLTQFISFEENNNLIKEEFINIIHEKAKMSVQNELIGFEKFVNFIKNKLYVQTQLQNQIYYYIKILQLSLKKERNININLQLNAQQQELLNKYYDANLFLIECLNNSQVSPEVRQEIEDTLLLPIAEIQKL